MNLRDRILPRAENLSLYIDSSRDLPRTALPFIWHFMRLLKVPALVTIVCWVTMSVLTVLEPYFVGRMVAILSQTGPAGVWRAILPVLLLYLLLCQVGSRVMGNTGHKIMNRVLPLLSMMVRERLSSYLYDHSYRYFQEDMAGRLAGKVMEMPQAVRDTVSDALDTFLWLVIVSTTSAIVFASLDWRLGLICLIYIACTVVVSRLNLADFSQLSERSAAAQQKMRGRYIDGISNILLVKLFARETYEKNILASALVETGTAEQARGVREVKWYRMQHAVNGSMQAAVALEGLLLYRQQILSLGQLTTALTLSLALASNVWYMMNFAATFFGRFAIIDEALGTILQAQEVKDTAAPLPLPPGRGDIALDRVTFAYPGRTVFRDFSLSIPAGQKLGLVGPSGAGKSTLMQLLLRLFDVQAGAIRIGGQDIRAVAQEDLRRAITVIPQATELMHRSILDNIRYGDLEAREEQVIEAARHAHMHETILAMRDQHGNSGYHALVGERGVKLSGGQRQRIAIARAFLKNAPVLILDEATSALDSESERLIQESFADLFRNRTVIAIAHRLSTIAHLDRIVVLEEGGIAEDGSHAALLAGGGLYARLWSLQSGGFLGQ